MGVDTTILLVSADEASNLRHSLPLAIAQDGGRVTAQAMGGHRAVLALGRHSVL